MTYNTSDSTDSGGVREERDGECFKYFISQVTNIWGNLIFFFSKNIGMEKDGRTSHTPFQNPPFYVGLRFDKSLKFSEKVIYTLFFKLKM